jgi:WD40 repeat protein
MISPLKPQFFLRIALLLVLLCAAFPLAAQEFTEDSTSAIAWNPAGDRLAIGVYDNTIEIWDAASDERLLTLRGHNTYIHALAWSPEGTRLASGDGDGMVIVWEVATGRQIAVLPSHGQIITAITWSPDGTTVLTDTDGINTYAYLQLWDADTGALIRNTGSRVSYHLFWSPDHQVLASAHIFKVSLLDPVTFQTIREIPQGTDQMWSTVWSPRGDVIAGGLNNGIVMLWDAGTGRLAAAFRANDHEREAFSRIAWQGVVALAFSADGTRLTAVSVDGTLRTWDVESGAVLASSTLESPVTDADFSADGERLAYSTPSLRYRVVSLPS